MTFPKTVDLIQRKRDGIPHTAQEISRLVEGFTAGEIPDCQMTAWLMAVFFRGMTMSETIALTRCMLESGETLDLRHLPGPKLDKHSTGGVGDKTSLILAPLIAVLGGVVPMISGRSLGFTGGTLDKLESIPGFRVHLSRAEFMRVLEKCGCAIIGQTEEMAPADRKIYSLRDATATIESVPLICGSILSKKLAEGLDGLVLDVKVGQGAFMSTLEEASDLAQHLVEVANGLGTRTVALITDMNQPLGNAAGNALEVREVIATLKGEGPSDLTRLCEKLAVQMLSLAAPATDRPRLIQQIRQALRSGLALDRFRRMIEAQGGNPQIIDHPDLLPRASHHAALRSAESGFIRGLQTRTIGECSMILGWGKSASENRVDPAAGIVVHKKIGDRVEVGEELCTLHTNDPARLDEVRVQILKAFHIAPHQLDPPPLIKRIIET